MSMNVLRAHTGVCDTSDASTRLVPIVVAAWSTVHLDMSPPLTVDVKVCVCVCGGGGCVCVCVSVSVCVCALHVCAVVYANVGVDASLRASVCLTLNHVT